MEGVSVGSYRITARIGEGGMGAVYAATHALLGRTAAIKVLLPEYSRNEEIVNRFFNEARAATAIRHPGIVEIYDFGYVGDGSAYIAMELLDGIPLSTRLKQRNRLPENEALWLVRQVAGALGAAHVRGIVHRDLKPDNVFLVRDPEVPTGERIKLLDFGIAKLSGDQGMSQRTRTGAVMGTPTYMAPEQCRGVGVDHRADLYSLGCILFELLCGRPPFVGEGVGDVLAAHIHVPAPSPRSIVPDLLPEVEQLVMALLAKDPAHRPQTAEQLIAAIDGLTALVGRPKVSALVSSPTIATPYVPGGSAPSLPPTPAPITYRPPTQPAEAGVSTVSAGGARTGLWIGVVGVALAAGIVIAVVVGKSGGSKSDASDPGTKPTEAQAKVKAAPVDAAPAPEPPRAAPDAAAPTRSAVTLMIDSSPQGAAVLDGAEKLGVTPLALERKPKPGTLHLTLELPGYHPIEMDVPGDSSVDRLVQLAKIDKDKPDKKPRRPKKPSGNDTKPEADRNDSVNPF